MYVIRRYNYFKEYRVESSEADIVPSTECEVFFPDFELTESNICMVLDHSLPYRIVSKILLEEV